MSETGVHVWLILWKAYAAVREHAERHIQSLGLCLSDFAVLEVLLHKGPLLVNTIGVRVRLTGPVPLADEEFGSVTEGTTLSTSLAFSLICVLLFLALRSVRLVVPILITLAMGLVIAAAFAA